MDAKQLAIDSIQKTNQAIEDQRQVLSEQVKQQIDAEKAQFIRRFEDNTADILNHYIMQAIGNQINLSDQLEYIIGELETNKEAMLEDIKRGA